VLLLDNGRILSSAGSAAGIDLCLHLVRRDCGAAAAVAAARWAVMRMERDADHSPRVVREALVSDASLAPLLRWMEQRLDRPPLRRSGGCGEGVAIQVAKRTRVS